MTINLRPLPWYGPILREHRVHTQTISPHYSTHWSVETDEIKNLAHRDLMVKSLVEANKKKALPSIQQLQIVNMTGRLEHDYPRDGNENMIFSRDDILANTTTRIPLRMLYFRSRRTFDQALSTPSILIRKTAHLFSGNCLRWNRKSREKPGLLINTNHTSRILLEIPLLQNINDLKVSSLWIIFRSID